MINLLKQTRAILSIALMFEYAKSKPFFDCEQNLGTLFDDTEALDIVKRVHREDKELFSSDCLERVLKKNF